MTVPDVRVPFLSLTPGEDDRAVRSAIERVIDRGWFILGPELEAFEAEFAAASGSAYSVGVNTGTDAIALLLRGLGIGPGDLVVYSLPAYGGTVTLLTGLLPEFGVVTRAFRADATSDDLESLVGGDRLTMVYVETPANPTNELIDLQMAADLAARHDALLVVDNTFLSPVWQKPIAHGADLTLHSATKFLGGHSDLTAGAVCGRSDLIARLKHTRYEIGTTPSPSTAWLLGRSLETLRMRVERQTSNATQIAAHLAGHDKVRSVHHLSLLEPGDPRFEIYKRQCEGPGAMISFEIDGGEEESFRFLDAMEVIRLATSLGGTESLASHPWTMSPPSVPEVEKRAIGVTPGLIRLSVGVEDPFDLIADLDQALASI